MKVMQINSDFGYGTGIWRRWKWILPLTLCGVLAAAAQNEGYSTLPLGVMEDPSGGVMIEWMREPGPDPLLGWHVERQLADGSVQRLSVERVAADLFDPPSCVYRFHDAGMAARAGESAWYRLVTVDPELREWPSPFSACVIEPASAAPLPDVPKTIRTPARVVSKAALPASLGERLRITVDSDGLYRLTAAQIAAALAGATESQVMQAIVERNLALSCGGEAVAWRGEPGDTALLFFGKAIHDVYMDRNVYFLAFGPGVSMESAVRTTSAVAPDPWFWETARAEQDLFFRPYVPGTGDDDYFIWTGKQLTSPELSWTWAAEVPVIDLHPAVKQGTVTAHLVSAYNGIPALDNRTIISAAGQVLDDRRWAGNVRLAQSGIATNLAGTRVPIAIELRRETDVTTTTVLIDALEVRYARRMRAQNDLLVFKPEAGTNLLTVRGFSNSAIRVLDVTNPLRPVELAATIASEGGGWRVSWTVDPSTSRRYLATAVLAAPERVDGVAAAGWDRMRAGAPYLVIAPQAMAGAAAVLVEHRRQQGLGSMLVPLEELYDDFAFGRRDPRAIPRFLAHAKTNWTVPPAYVCLAGDGHLDYHDHFGQSQSRPNHVPPILERVYSAKSCGLRATVGVDNPLGDTDGNGVPDLAIGRLPAQTPEALSRMINRIIVHEASDGWKNKALVVSDKESTRAFEQTAGRLAARGPTGLAIQRVSHDELPATEAMRNSFIQAMNSGIPLSVYVGHANNCALGSSYFFSHTVSQSFLPALTNQTRVPLFLPGACLVNDFAQPDPESRCIGKGFLDSAPGGAVAVWGAATETTLSMAESTIGAIMDGLSLTSEARLGDLVRLALDVQVKSVSPWMVRSSVLMGDPGTRIRTAMASVNPAPAILITSPVPAGIYAASTNRIDIAGEAFSPNGVREVVVRNGLDGDESLAAGTTRWSLGGLELGEGTNLISATVYDASGNSATATIQVVYSSELDAWPLPGLVEIENFDFGGQNVSYLDRTVANQGGKYRPQEAVDIVQDADAGNGHVVGWTEAGEWLEYTVNVKETGVYTLKTRVSAQGSGGRFRILFNGTDRTGPLAVPNTGSWNRYQIVQKKGVELSAGIHTVRVAMVQNGASGFVGAFDWFKVGTPPPRAVYSNGTPWALPGVIEIENFDIGDQNVGYYDTAVANEGGQYRLEEEVGIARDPVAGNGHVVGWTTAGEWLEYTVNVSDAGYYVFITRVSAQGAGGQFRILVNGMDKTGVLNVPDTRNWNAYQEVKKTGVYLSAGTQVLRLAMVRNGVSGCVGAFDWLKVVVQPPRSAYLKFPWALPGTVEIENFDISGENAACFDTTMANEGGQYRPDEEVDIARDPTAGNGYVIGWTKAGEWLEYTVNVAEAGLYTLKTRVAAQGAGGQFRILVNGEDKTGVLNVPNTGLWNAYQVVQKTGVAFSSGIQTVRVAMVASGPSGHVGAFDWFAVVAPQPRTAYPNAVPWALPGIVEIENFDISGDTMAYLDTTFANEGKQYRPEEAVDISHDPAAGNGYVVGWTKAGEWLEYTVNVGHAGQYTLETRVAGVGTGGQFRILVNGEDKTGLLNVPNTGRWNAYDGVQKTNVDLSSGIQTVRVVMVQNGTSGFVGAFDWFGAVVEECNDTGGENTGGARRMTSRSNMTSAADADLEMWPLTWVRTGDGGWTVAPDLVDGNINTVWTGKAGASSWSLALDFEESIALESLEIDWEEGAGLEIGVMGSDNLKEWCDLDLATERPVTCRVIYIFIRGDSSGSIPAIREINWEGALPF